MLEIDIPGFGPVRLEYLVSDFTGTLSEDGRLVQGVRERLILLSRDLEIHILTADTFGTAEKQLQGIPCRVQILSGQSHDLQKKQYVMSLGPEKVVAIGNGNNDREMLRTARVGIAVALSEGCARDALLAADIFVKRIEDGLDLLIRPKRLRATLRF